MRPSVQGAAVVLENKTGRILAMAGGFSYPLSQLNRATQAHRQPGSAIKPLTYLAALAKGLQPNTLVWDTPVTLPPIGGGVSARTRTTGRRRTTTAAAAGIMTLRRALENSKNLVTARLLDGGIADDPERSLGAGLRAGARGAALRRMRAALSLRARRPAGPAHRSRRLLRRDRQRGRAAVAATPSRHRGGRPRGLPAQAAARRCRSAPPTAPPSIS